MSGKHSRYHETQADDYGYDFLKRCGKNPWAMGLAFKKLKAISQRKDRSKYEKWFEDEEVVDIINDVADNCCPGTAAADIAYRGDQELVLCL